MYTKFNTTRVDILSEECVSNTLTLFIEPSKPMNEVYDLFSKNSLANIILYNNDDTMHSVRAGYETIESFVFNPVDKFYMIVLSKKLSEDLATQVKDQKMRLDELSKDVAAIQNGDLIKQSEYALQILVSTFTDVQALNCILLFPEWNENAVSYKKDERIRYSDKFYKVLQDHVSQADWIPGQTPSLYVEVSDPSIEYPEWKQPSGSHDAYQIGDKVTFKNKKYESLINSNVYSPEAYPAGWKEIN